MCHHHTNDWLSERRGEFDEADDDPDREYDDGMAGREFDEPEVEAPDLDAPEADDTPDLDDGERSATPSDD